MDIQIQVKGIDELVRNLRDIGVNRIPNYTARALTEIANQAQDAMMGNARSMLTIRGNWLVKGYKYGINRPREDVVPIKIPDSTPEIVEMYALSDEQALLAKVRYNRLIDVFLGITTYSLQNHLRTTVKEIGQIEVDELYVGVNKAGAHFVIPVQAKGGKDKIGAVQTQQDVLCCEEKFPAMIVRPVSVQFMEDTVIAMFELTYSKKTGEFGVLDEKHYRLVQSADIDKDDLQRYKVNV